MDDDKVNILLVDDQPQAARLRGDSRRARRESGQGVVGARGAGIPAQERRRGRPDRRLHAGARRLPARGHDPRASAFPEDGDHLHLGDPGDDVDRCAATRWARWITCRCRSCPKCCAPRSRSSPSCTARRGARAAERRARAARGASAPPSSKPRTRGSCKASRAAAWRSPPARWARGTGTSSAANAMWDEGQYRIFGVDPRKLSGHRRTTSAAMLHPDDWDRLRQSGAAHGQGRTHACRPNSACVRPERRACAGAPARRPRASMPPAAWCASAASPSTSPIAKRPRSARICWRARSITAPAMRSPSSSRSSG